MKLLIIVAIQLLVPFTVYAEETNTVIVKVNWTSVGVDIHNVDTLELDGRYYYKVDGEEKNSTCITVDLKNGTHLQFDGDEGEDDLPDSPKGHSDVLFSEVNTDNPGTNNQQYFELVKISDKGRSGRKRKNTLPGYRVLIVKGSPLSIVLSVDLSKQEMKFRDGNHFLVLGAPTVANVDIDITAEDIASIYKYNGGTDVLPVGDDSPYALILLQADSPKLTKDLTLYKNEVGIYVPFNFENDKPTKTAIIAFTKDMVVIGRRTTTDSCSFFDEIWPQSSKVTHSRRFLVRDWDRQSAHFIDLSLNRCCPDGVPFNPECFRYGKLSPGTTNDCTGEPFFVETNIDSLSPFTPSTSVEQTSLPGCHSTIDAITPSRYRDIDEEAFHRSIEEGIRAPKCARRFNSETVVATDRMDIDVNNQLIVRGGGTAVVPWYSRDIVPEIIRDVCRKQFANEGAILYDNHVLEWLDITMKDGKCYLSCRPCKSFFDKGFRPDVKHKKNIQTPEGFWSRDPSKMNKALLDHAGDEVHPYAVKFEYGASRAATRIAYEKVVEEFENMENKIFLPTMRMVQFVYTETIVGAPFYQHEKYMGTLARMDVNVGHHNRHPKGAKNMMTVCSKNYHEKLLKSLVATKAPFAILVDTTTDSMNIPYLIVYIQTLEDGYPIVYFYALIELKNGETAVEMFKSLIERLNSDDQLVPGFLEYFKNFIVAYSSDGASSMKGRTNSFYVELKKYINRTIPAIQCMAHKINLSIRRAIMKSKNPKFKFFQTFEKGCNTFFVFYQSRGSKKWIHLVQVADECHITPTRLKYFFDIRWASSEFAVIEAIYKDYDLLKIDLTAIALDPSFTEAGRQTARDLHERLSDKGYSIVIREFLDFLTVYKGMSLALQQSAGLLIGKASVIQKGINEFLKLKQNPGPYVSEFLSKCTCQLTINQVGLCEDGGCTLEEYDRCPRIIYNSNSLTDMSVDTVKLSEVREELYDNLIEQMNYYFDLDLLKSFDLLDVRNLILPMCRSLDPNDREYTIPTSLNEAYVITSGPTTKTLDRLCELFVISKDDCVTLNKEWLALIVEIAQKDDLMANGLGQDPAMFWPYAKTYVNLPWTPLTSRLIDLAMVTPFGTSDCERGFSYVTSIKKDRGDTSPETLEDLVRILVNGPENIEDFNAQDCTKKYLKAYIRVDDATFAGGRKRMPEKLKSFWRSSRLF